MSLMIEQQIDRYAHGNNLTLNEIRRLEAQLSVRLCSFRLLAIFSEKSEPLLVTS